MDSTELKMTDKELTALGIVRTTVDVYHVGEYNYSSLKYAVEEANRNIAKKLAGSEKNAKSG